MVVDVDACGDVRARAGWVRVGAVDLRLSVPSRVLRVVHRPRVVHLEGRHERTTRVIWRPRILLQPVRRHAALRRFLSERRLLADGHVWLPLRISRSWHVLAEFARVMRATGRETYGFCNRSLSYHSTRTMHTLHPPRAGCRRAHQERHATDKKKGSCFCHTPLFRYELRGLRLYTIGYAKQYHGVPVVLKWQLHMHVDVRTSCIFAHRSCAQH